MAALAGDVAAPELASSEESRRLLAECDHVIHSAADVRAIVRDEDLFRANVEGTRNVLALAQANGAVMHHLSTLGINGTVGEGEAVLAEDDLDIGQVIDDPYARTKFAAERVVREHVAAGGTATVSRLGNAAPHSLTGRLQRNWRLASVSFAWSWRRSTP